MPRTVLHFINIKECTFHNYGRGGYCKYGGVKPYGKMFCQYCEVVRPSFHPRQIVGYARGSVCAVCGWIYERTEISNGKRKRVYKTDDYECVYCGSKEKLCVDHVIAELMGGTNDYSNLVTACRSCNAKKLQYEVDWPMLYGRFRDK